jgi:hypothetical protein
MKLWLVCYANRRYTRAQQALLQSAKGKGFDRVCAFNEYLLQGTEFYKQHRSILSAPCGGGYWLWKPYYIAQILHEAAPDDVVLYCDAAIEFIADIRPLVEICREGAGITLFQTHDHWNIEWTKRDCLVGMNCDEARFHNAQQVMGGFHLFRRCATSLEFVDAWLSRCCQPELLTDEPSKCGLPEYPQFVAHRHDQSILSLLAEMWRLPIYREPSQWGLPWAMPDFRPTDTPVIESPNPPYANSPYGQILNLHRRPKGPRRNLVQSLARQVGRIRFARAGSVNPLNRHPL